MVWELEQKLVQALRKVLDPLADGAWIEDSADWSQASNLIERYIDAVIDEVHPNTESSDGLMSAFRKRVNANEILVAGNTWMLDREANCFVAPFHLQLQFSPTEDEVTWFECRLGERGEKGMKHDAETSVKKLAILLERTKTPGFIDQLDWFYKVTFGERRVQSEG